MSHAFSDSGPALNVRLIRLLTTIVAFCAGVSCGQGATTVVPCEPKSDLSLFRVVAGSCEWCTKVSITDGAREQVFQIEPRPALVVPSTEFGLWAVPQPPDYNKRYGIYVTLTDEPMMEIAGDPLRNLVAFVGDHPIGVVDERDIRRLIRIGSVGAGSEIRQLVGEDPPLCIPPTETDPKVDALLREADELADEVEKDLEKGN